MGTVVEVEVEEGGVFYGNHILCLERDTSGRVR